MNNKPMGVILGAKEKMELIEKCAAAVHRAYCENFLQRTGATYWTLGDYNELSEETKEIDRVTVRAVIETLQAEGFLERKNSHGNEI